MPLGPHVPVWNALADELSSLASDLDYCLNVLVFDAWGYLWCRASPLSSHEQTAILERARAVLDRAARPLERGGKIRTLEDEPPLTWYWHSYAGVYLLGLQIERSYTELMLQPVIRRHLTRIEELTVALPPPDGPTRGSAEGTGAA